MLTNSEMLNSSPSPSTVLNIEDKQKPIRVMALHDNLARLIFTDLSWRTSAAQPVVV
jgi:hypothetical protein